jgi:cob(I)alamin adenosyltransferase
VKNFIAAQSTLARLEGKMQDAGDDAPALRAELDAVAKQHGFSDFGQLDEVAANISIVMAGLNPDTGEFTDPVDVMKMELKNVKGDESIPGEEKEEIVTELIEAIETSPAVVHPHNIELVKAHRKAIDKALQ